MREPPPEPRRPASSGQLRRALTGLWLRACGSRRSRASVALSVAVGLAVGLSPFYGLHWVLVPALCWPLRLDAALAYAATMVSNPVTLPFLVLAELELGGLCVGHGTVTVEQLLTGAAWGDAALQLALGSALLATPVAALGGVGVWLALPGLGSARANGA